MPKLLIKSMLILRNARFFVYCGFLCVLGAGLLFSNYSLSYAQRSKSVEQGLAIQLFRIAGYLVGGSPAKMCFVGDDKVYQIFRILTSKSSRFSSTEMLFFKGYDESLKTCNVLYFSSSLGGSIGGIMKKVSPDKYGIVTISEASGFISNNMGIIQLTIQDEEFNFALNVKKMRDRKFKISSKLIEAAGEAY